MYTTFFQIQKWGENAKWKIDLVLLDNSQNNSRQDSPSLRSQQQQPQNLRITTTVGNQGYMLPVSNSTQYPVWKHHMYTFFLCMT